MSQTQAPKLAVLTTEEPNFLDQVVARTLEAVQRAAPAVQPMELRSFDELERWAERVCRSKMVPRDYQLSDKNQEAATNIILAVQLGSELGLRPMQSLQNIAVINGRPTVWGDAMMALCMTHPLWGGAEERIDGSGENATAVCTVIRRGMPPVVRTFSVQDAITAKLWGKRGYDGKDTPWITNPMRMLQMRARGFALRDAFPDKLKGLVSAEEASDYDMGQSGFSAAPPVIPQPTTPAEKPKWMQIVDAFAAVQTAEDYYGVIDEHGERIAWLKTNKPDVFAQVDAARKSAADRMTDTPVAEAPAAQDDEVVG